MRSARDGLSNVGDSAAAGKAIPVEAVDDNY